MSDTPLYIGCHKCGEAYDYAEDLPIHPNGADECAKCGALNHTILLEGDREYDLFVGNLYETEWDDEP